MHRRPAILGLVAALHLLAAAATARAGSVTFPGFRTVIVGPVPGDPVGSGTGLLNALAGINPTSCPGDYWLLKILPGTYDLGSNSLVMKPCVDIEGSGQLVTKIRADGGSDNLDGAAVIASDAELRMLSVESSGTGLRRIGIYALGTNPRITQVTATASGGDNAQAVTLFVGSAAQITDVTAIASGAPSSWGVFAFGSTSVIARSTITASGTSEAVGVRAQESKLTMTDVTVSGTDWGVLNDLRSGWGPVTIQRSTLTGTIASIETRFAPLPGFMDVATTQLNGPVIGSFVRCVGNYDANFAPVTCP